MESTIDTKKQNKKPKTSPMQETAKLHAETPQPGETPQSIGGFQLGEIAGQVTVRRDPEVISLSFEFSAPMTDPIDVIIGPPQWSDNAEVYETRGVPVVANAAIVQVDRSELQRLAQDGRVCFHARVHDGRYINLEGRPFENFSLTLRLLLLARLRERARVAFGNAKGAVRGELLRWLLRGVFGPGRLWAVGVQLLEQARGLFAARYFAVVL